MDTTNNQKVNLKATIINSGKKREEEKKEEEKKKASINVGEPIRFDANIKSCFINTIELSSVVDELFGPVFNDYVGCKISLNDGSAPITAKSEIPYGGMYVSLYFKDCALAGDEFVKNVRTRITGKGSNKFDSMMKLYGASAGRMYDVLPDTYDLLEEFRFFQNRKANWNLLTYETTTSYGYVTSMQQEIVVCITGLSLERIINKIYSGTTGNGHYQYQVAPVQIVANINGEYVVQITQLDMDKLNDLRRSLGGPVNRAEFHQFIR